MRKLGLKFADGFKQREARCSLKTEDEDEDSIIERILLEEEDEDEDEDADADEDEDEDEEEDDTAELLDEAGKLMGGSCRRGRHCHSARSFAAMSSGFPL